MKCLGSIFGQFIITVNEDKIGASFLSGLFNNLVYLFDFHHSLNTFYFGKVSAFLLDYLQDTFMVSPTQCLGLGIIGCTQGGEHLNKKLKKWLYSWTGGRGNFMFYMLEDFVDIFIGGLCDVFVFFGF